MGGIIVLSLLYRKAESPLLSSSDSIDIGDEGEEVLANTRLRARVSVIDQTLLFAAALLTWVHV